jgi:hypothetical protein
MINEHLQNSSDVFFSLMPVINSLAIFLLPSGRNNIIYITFIMWLVQFGMIQVFNVTFNVFSLDFSKNLFIFNLEIIFSVLICFLELHMLYYLVIQYESSRCLPITSSDYRKNLNNQFFERLFLVIILGLCLAVGYFMEFLLKAYHNSVPVLLQIIIYLIYSLPLVVFLKFPESEDRISDEKKNFINLVCSMFSVYVIKVALLS